MEPHSTTRRIRSFKQDFPSESKQLLEVEAQMATFGTNSNGTQASCGERQIELNSTAIVEESVRLPQGEGDFISDINVDDEYITGTRLWLILFSGMLVQFVIMLDHCVIATVSCTLFIRIQPCSLTG